jgi:hypothetical protein
VSELGLFVSPESSGNDKQILKFLTNQIYSVFKTSPRKQQFLNIPHKSSLLIIPKLHTTKIIKFRHELKADVLVLLKH